MTPETTEAGPSQPGSATTQVAPHEQQPHGTATSVTAVVFGTRLLASGDAHYDRILVRRCSLCGFPHWHIAFESGASSIERAPACAKHRTYLIEITDVVPVGAERRQRGAA